MEAHVLPCCLGRQGQHPSNLWWDSRFPEDRATPVPGYRLLDHEANGPRHEGQEVRRAVRRLMVDLCVLGNGGEHADALGRGNGRPVIAQRIDVSFAAPLGDVRPGLGDSGERCHGI